MSPSSAPLPSFLAEVSSKIDYGKKGHPYSNLSAEGPFFLGFTKRSRSDVWTTPFGLGAFSRQVVVMRMPALFQLSKDFQAKAGESGPPNGGTLDAKGGLNRQTCKMS